tara:strand:+ start:183 stop:338 length:156 start_codon:yes stop_codon:yes gene_type:complete
MKIFFPAAIFLLGCFLIGPFNSAQSSTVSFIGFILIACGGIVFLIRIINRK